MTIHPMTPPEWAELPKFLFCDNCDFSDPDPAAPGGSGPTQVAGGREFVLHCHYPRFLVEFIGDAGTPIFIDPQAEFIHCELAAGREPAQTLARLLRDAGDFFNT